MSGSKTFASRWLVLSDLHIGITEANLYDVAVFILYVHRELFTLAWCAKRFVELHVPLEALS